VAGGIIVAPEGINGSICGTRGGIDAILSFLRSDPRLASMRNTEGPGPAEAAPPRSPVGAARKAGQESRGGAGVGAGGEELKATPFQQDRVHVKVKKEVSRGYSVHSSRLNRLRGCERPLLLAMFQMQGLMLKNAE
jgi:hypothetical protein